MALYAAKDNCVPCLQLLLESCQVSRDVVSETNQYSLDDFAEEGGARDVQQYLASLPPRELPADAGHLMLMLV